MTEATCTIKVGEDERELFMSYNLLRHLSSMFGAIQDLPMMASDVSLHAQFIGKILAGPELKYDETKLDDEIFEQIPLDDVDKMTNWAVEHVTDFFLKRAESLLGAMTKNQDRIEKASSVSSQPG